MLLHGGLDTPEVPTVKIVDGEGFLIINAEDFDSKTMTLYVEPPVPLQQYEANEGDPAINIPSGAIVMAQSYGGESSYQPVAADLELEAGAGVDVGDSSFLAPVMGNVLGDDLTKTGNYIAGVIGALSVTGDKATEFQQGALIGIVMDGVTAADGAVVAVIDGSDPSAKTTVNALFAGRMNNASAESGADYGVDLYDAGRGAAYTDTGKPLAIFKAVTRSPHEVCDVEGDGAPVDGTTGKDFAGKGSRYTDYTNGELYINTGTKASPAWKIVTHA